MLKEEIEDSAPVCGFSIPFMLLCYCGSVLLSFLLDIIHPNSCTSHLSSYL